MKTIEIYEGTETAELKLLLKKYENLLEENELSIDEKEYRNGNYLKLKKVSDDYEIDISLIRMELNKRLWEEDWKEEYSFMFK